MIKYIPLLLLIVMFPAVCEAFSPDTYADKSVLSEGRWVKVSVPRSGMYRLTAPELKKMGFSDPSRVLVYGYGGRRISDVLTLQNYIDDLPQTPSYFDGSSVCFYGVGPEEWQSDTKGFIKRTVNPFSSVGYYYITESDTERRVPKSGGIAEKRDAFSVFCQPLCHENDQFSLGQSGHLLVGEDLRYTPVRTFNFNLPGRVEGTELSLRVDAATRTGSPSTISVAANGSPVGKVQIAPTTGSNYGVSSFMSAEIPVPDSKLSVELRFSSSGTVHAAHLDAVNVNYMRYISLSEGVLDFSTSATAVSIKDVKGKLHIWDVTTPGDALSMNFVEDGSAAFWVKDLDGERVYSAWVESAALPSPTVVCEVGNQNLHSIIEVPDMVIFTVSDWASQAERIAEAHRNGVESLDVLVVDRDMVFNEFGSGSRDINALRWFLKMLYDRGRASGKPLRYAMLMGRATYDNRMLTAEMSGLGHQFMPTWQSDESLWESESYTSDDILAFLEDGAGLRMASDRYCIGVGRLPVGTLREAREYTDKLLGYMKSTDSGQWKNNVMLLADDGDNGIHMEQSEVMADNFIKSDAGGNMFYNKVYIDAFDVVGGVCVGARERLYRLLDEGVAWWTFIGHAGYNFMTGENIMTYNDIKNMSSTRFPVFYGATCLFAKWDAPDRSGAELMALNPRGGIIAAITATRTVWISENGRLSDAISKEMFSRDESGMPLTVGEIYRRAKNRLASPSGQSNSNKLRYVLLGDPAMHFTTPSKTVALETIGDVDVNPENQPTIMARQNVELKGSVYDELGRLIDNLDGTISVSLYDAEHSTTSSGRTASNTPGKKVTFEEQGDMLYVGRDSVKSGRFSVNVSMPSEIADNFRPAALNMYVKSSSGDDAIGCNRDFYVFGYDDTAAPDTVAPIIDYCYLNHESFKPGDAVNESPMFIARVSDNVGINLSSSGIGRRMTIKLDQSEACNDVSMYYTPDSDGSPGGRIAYPLGELADGNHSIEFRVWDTSGNSAKSELDFFVQHGLSPVLFDVYTDANPASVEANFYVSHNRPDAILKVTVEVYNLLGSLVWMSTVTDKSSMFMSAPVKWDLCDMAGNRVNRGIYVYKASISSDGEEQQSLSKRIAVTGR